MKNGDDPFAPAGFDAAEYRQLKARLAVRQTAYDAGKAAGKTAARACPSEFRKNDDGYRDWLRGYDDAQRPEGYYLIEYRGERCVVEWDGIQWFYTGYEPGSDRVDKIISKVDLYPELADSDF